MSSDVEHYLHSSAQGYPPGSRALAKLGLTPGQTKQLADACTELAAIAADGNRGHARTRAADIWNSSTFDAIRDQQDERTDPTDDINDPNELADRMGRLDW